MNEEEMGKAISALAGGAQGQAAEAAGGGGDWEAKFKDMERKFQSAKVEEGRVKKLDEENKALRRELEQLKGMRQAEEVMDDLPDEMKDMPPEMLKATSYMARKTAERALAERDAELQAMKAQMSDRTQRQFGARIEQEFPGFLKSAVSETGDKHAAWVEYQKPNAASINYAVKNLDFDTLAWHIRQFYTNELGIAAPSGGTGAAAPDPSSTGGGTPVVTKPGKTYTQQEIADLYDEVERARDRGDFAEVKRLGAEIDKAMREGRVK